MNVRCDIQEINEFASELHIKLPELDLLSLPKFAPNRKDFGNELWAIYSLCSNDIDLDKRRFQTIAGQILAGKERQNSQAKLNNFAAIINKVHKNSSIEDIFSNWGIMLEKENGSQKTNKIDSWRRKWLEMNTCLESLLCCMEAKDYWHTLSCICYLFCKNLSASFSKFYERLSLVTWLKFTFEKKFNLHFAFPLWDRVLSRNVECSSFSGNWKMLTQILYQVLLSPNDTKRSHNFLLEYEGALKKQRHLEENIKKYQDRWDNSMIKKYLEENADSLDDLCADLNTTREFLTDVWRKSVMGIAIEGCEQFIAEYEKAFLKLMQQDELKIEVFALLAHLSSGLISYKEWEGQKNGKLGGRGNKKLQA